ncbi:hypothetical protein [Salinibacterium sp. M195]|uniref:Ig-like domain-containing protein n=1 Tax=Salinibacterium sp. M195 TaxID=2583374 RepID=UPI001C62B4A8|nr:hypothetical protein [Salinibacterium sp. M195]QYH35987.1 hypothetical protein FFT87_08505 [Salinibacterium sp. M195]
MKTATPKQRRVVAAGSAFGLAAVLVATGATAASAAPAPAAETITFTGDQYTSVVPGAACGVTINAVGGGGGAAPFPFPPLNPGAGADITATYKVTPGMAISAEVGGAGEPGAGRRGAYPAAQGGWPNGGNGGHGGLGFSGDGGVEGTHTGGSGGGATSISIGGMELIVAGGGGGIGFGPTIPTTSDGGNAGLPTSAGAVAGSNGEDGADDIDSSMVRGGQGGQESDGGAGGTYSARVADVPASEQALLAGFSGAGNQGGAGGNGRAHDTNDYSTGGGGGGGYFGGGGGAATYGGDSSAGGGGGGASYVNENSPSGNPASALGVSSSLGLIPVSRGQGSFDGTVTLTWLECGILTDSGLTHGDIDETQRFAPSPTDEGSGDVVIATATELLNAAGDAVTELATPGVGTFTVEGSDIVFTPASGYVGASSLITYRITDAEGRTTQGLYKAEVTDGGEPPVDPTDPSDGDPGVGDTDDGVTIVPTSDRDALASTGSATGATAWLAAALLALGSIPALFTMVRRRKAL